MNISWASISIFLPAILDAALSIKSNKDVVSVSISLTVCSK